jgi:MATE family, multidrug efflux pump
VNRANGAAAAGGGVAHTARTVQMLSAAPLGLLLRMASPNAMAFLVQASVSMVEVWYIGQLGTLSLAAIALVFPGLMLMQMLAGGAMGGAVTSSIARALGAHDHARAARLVWHAIALALGGGALFLGVYLVFGAVILGGLGATGEVLRDALGYGDTLFGGCVALWLAALLSSVFRGMGDMRYPALLMVCGALVQVMVSGTLVLGWFGAPRLGIAGAAIAAISVAALNTLALGARLIYGNVAVPLRRRYLQLHGELFRDIFRVGALGSLAPIFTVLTISLVNALVSDFGAAAIAGYGISARLEFLLIPLVFGLGVSMTSLVGVNIGAGNIARAERIGWVGGACATLLAGVVGGVLALAPGLWVGLFTDDAAVYAAGAAYLHVAGPAFALQGLGLSLYFASQGARAMAWPVAATILRFAISVGGAWFAVRVFDAGMTAVFGCIALGMLSYGALTAIGLAMGSWRRAAV